MVKILHEVKTLKDFNESRCLKKLTVIQKYQDIIPQEFVSLEFFIINLTKNISIIKSVKSFNSSFLNFEN